MSKRILLLIIGQIFLHHFLSAQKNVLFIAVDDLKPILSPYGNTTIQTPHIDRLADMGTTFLNASCQQAVCGPSRASLLTGWYPDHTEVWDLNTLIRDRNPEVVTLPQYFKENGYVTTGGGKMFDPRSVDDDYDAVSWSQAYVHSVDVSYYNSTYGDGFSGYHDSRVEADRDAFKAYINDHPDENENEVVKMFPFAKPATESLDLPDDAYKDGATANYLIEKLDALAAGSQPFFLGAGFSKPHLPFVAPKKYWDLYSRSEIPLAAFQQQPADVPALAWRVNGEMTNTYSDVPWYKDRDLNEDEQRRLIHGYMACVSYIDAQIGKVLDKLYDLGLTDNTIIVLWGDHGWHLGDHNLWAKHSNFEQAVRSPLIVIDPSVGSGGQVSASPVEFVDLFPTLIELTGLDEKTDLDGKSLVPILENPQAKIRDAALAQYHRTDGGFDHMGYTLRSETYRYTKWIKMDYKAGERYGENVGTQLYDLENDPNETVNLASDAAYQEVVDFFELEFKKRNVAQSTPSSFQSISTCGNSYEAPDGTIYTESGIYTSIIDASNGMDSVITIDLSFVSDLQAEVLQTGDFLAASIDGAEYKWKNCDLDNYILGAVTQNYQPPVSGNYAVEVTSGNCSALSSCFSFVKAQPLNVDNSGFTLFPVPITDNMLNINLHQTYNQVRVQLVSLSGQIFLSEDHYAVSQIQLIINQDSGMYILRLQADNVILEGKVMVE